MHLQEKTLNDLDLGVKVTQNVPPVSQHHVTYAPAKVEVVASNSLGRDALTKNTFFDLGVKVIQNVAQYHLIM